MTFQMMYIRKLIKYNISKLIYIIKENKAITIIICGFFLSFIFGLLETVLSCSIVYGMTLLKDLLEHKKEKDRIESIDIDYFKTAQDNLEDPLDGYVDMCINEYMLLNRGYNNETYIKEKEELEIRKGVIELLSTNMSPTMKHKFELYYGKGQVEAVLARKCFIRIALYVANINKNAYSEDTGEEKLDNLFRETLMMKE